MVFSGRKHIRGTPISSEKSFRFTGVGNGIAYFGGEEMCIQYRNFIFTGKFTLARLSYKTLFRSFRSTDGLILRHRYNVVMSHYYRIRSCCYGFPEGSFHPFYSILKVIRRHFNASDIIKMWQIDGNLYDTEEVAKVYRKFPEIAKSYYINYVANTKSPLDIETYGKFVNIKLQEKHVRHLIKTGNIVKLQKYLSYISLTDMEIRDKDLYYHKFEINHDMLNMLLSAGVSVWSNDDLTRCILEKCNI